MRLAVSLSQTLLVASLAPLSACIDSVNGRGAAAPLVRVHAEKDLDCPSGEIRVIEEISGRYKAIGCGRVAYYRAACEALSCVVSGENDPSIPWRDRPDPNLPVSPR